MIRVHKTSNGFKIFFHVKDDILELVEKIVELRKLGYTDGKRVLTHGHFGYAIMKAPKDLLEKKSRSPKSRHKNIIGKGLEGFEDQSKMFKELNELLKSTNKK